MPAHLKYQWRFAAVGSDRANDQVNTWHFQVEATPPAAGTMTAITTALTSYYQGMAALLSGTVVTGLCDVKVYNMADPEPRNPITTFFPTITSLASTTSLSPEITFVQSFEAIPVSGINQQRRRGRVYLPTFLQSATTGACFLSGSGLSTLDACATSLLAASDAASDWSWMVFSPTSGALAPVARGWVDNAPDIQRRRGWKATVRSTFP